MLTKEENERLTRVGPGTPMGNLLRRYWHPVAGSVELTEQPTKAVRLLGEDLVLYRDGGGTLGLVQRACPHRGVNLKYGMVEEHGLRCPYHGWLFDETGRCLEQPFEDTVKPDSDLKGQAGITAYAVQEYAGLVWAYLGPAPAPLLPHWDILTWENCLRHVAFAHLPCNWLQVVENNLDPANSAWLQGRYTNYIRRGRDRPPRPVRERLDVNFELFNHGIVPKSLEEQGHGDPQWGGYPVIFPNAFRHLNVLKYRVPVDDTHTMEVYYRCHLPPTPEVQVPPQDAIPVFEWPIFDESGEFLLDTPPHFEALVKVSPGALYDRSTELLGESDRVIVAYRELLEEQLAKVEAGQDPMNVFRDPERSAYIVLPTEKDPNEGPPSREVVYRHSPIFDQIHAMHANR